MSKLLRYHVICVVIFTALCEAQGQKPPATSQHTSENPRQSPFSLEGLPEPNQYLEEMHVFFNQYKNARKSLTGASFIGVGRAGENAYGTWGFLFVEDGGQLVHKGYTLEPRSSVGRGPITVGTYDYRKWDSPTLRKTLRLYNVPGRTDILVHVGNTQGDTQGCILVGTDVDSTSAPTRLINSRVLIDNLYDNYPAGSIAVVSQ